MRHSLDRIHYTHTRRVDTSVRHHYYISCLRKQCSMLQYCTLKEANEYAYKMAQFHKVPLFEISIKRA